MRRAEGNLPYAAVRVQARHGRRADESTWRRLEASGDFGQYLGVARASVLAPWVDGMDEGHDAHAMERALRGAWGEYVRAMASWHPQEWQPWLNWWRWLPVLPLISRLARAEAVPVWLLADPVCGPIAPGSPAERATALGATELAPLAAVVRGEASAGAAWLEHAAHLAPRIDPESRDRLSRLMRLLSADAEELTARSPVALRQLFRAAGGTAIASGCHLALLSLDLERLRGGLAVRRLFPALPAEAA